MTPLQGNLDFFLIRASRGPFRLKHKTQGPSHIPISEGRGIGPHLAGRGTSHGFSRVAAGTWGILSSYSGDVQSKL